MIDLFCTKFLKYSFAPPAEEESDVQFHLILMGIPQYRDGRRRFAVSPLKSAMYPAPCGAIMRLTAHEFAEKRW
jgi:hypothetical protein